MKRGAKRGPGNPLTFCDKFAQWIETLKRSEEGGRKFNRLLRRMSFHLILCGKCRRALLLNYLRADFALQSVLYGSQPAVTGSIGQP